MSSWYDQAKDKLMRGVKEVKGQKETAMKESVKTALLDFCRQDAEFAQAVVQGGTFSECMNAVANGCGNAISDLEAFRRAVRFYFPGADVKFHMTVNLCADVEAEAQAASPKILSFRDFL